MTNLEWIRTLSAEELSQWFYDKWLARLQHMWSSSQGGLVIWLKEQRAEQPKRGKWIAVTNGRGGSECSLCHEYAPSYKSGDEHLTNFCPNCGADMRGESDD